MEATDVLQEAMQAQFDFHANHDPVDTDLDADLAAEPSTMTDSFVPAEDHAVSDAESPECVHEDRLWIDDGWTARIIKNEDDDGWAVAMCKDGESEPALVGPWTMGRDKKNPKPLDTAAFNTLVKTASEVLRRHEQQLHALLHKSIRVSTRTATIDVTLDIIPDEDDPYALLSAIDDVGDQLAQVRVAANFKLTRESALTWIENDFRKPG